MALISDLFRGDPLLEACLADHAAHLTRGTKGPHVGKVQLALTIIDGLTVGADEEKAELYGPNTARAVLDFKTRRKIVNASYQSAPDDIVGKMTITALDIELLRKQRGGKGDVGHYCGHELRGKAGGGGERARLFAAPAGGGKSIAKASFGVTAPGPGSPATVAISRAAGAVAAVTAATLTLGRLIAFHRRPVIPVPAGLGAEWDALWANFGLPQGFPKNHPVGGAEVKNLTEYLAAVEQVLGGMKAALSQAATLFLEPSAPVYESAHAFTLRGQRASTDPANEPDGMYFNPRFLADEKGGKVGPLKQTEVVIHESSHFVNNLLIQDVTPQVLTSAYGYSNYVLHCAFRREQPFADSE